MRWMSLSIFTWLFNTLKSRRTSCDVLSCVFLHDVMFLCTMSHSPYMSFVLRSGRRQFLINEFLGFENLLHYRAKYTIAFNVPVLNTVRYYPISNTDRLCTHRVCHQRVFNALVFKWVFRYILSDIYNFVEYRLYVGSWIQFNTNHCSIILSLPLREYMRQTTYKQADCPKLTICPSWTSIRTPWNSFHCSSSFVNVFYFAISGSKIAHHFLSF